MEGDSEANIAYFCLHQLHLTPSQFFSLTRQERAFIIAAVEVKVEQEKQQRKQIERRRNN